MSSDVSGVSCVFVLLQQQNPGLDLDSQAQRLQMCCLARVRRWLRHLTCLLYAFDGP